MASGKLPIGAFPIGEAIPDPLFLLTQGGRRLIWMNAAAEVWLGRSLPSVAGQMLSQLAPGFEKIANIVETGDNAQGLFKGDGLQIEPQIDTPYMCSYRVFPCTAGTAVLISSYVAGAAQIDTKRNEAVNMFGQMLAHELKNPLAGIRGAAQLLQAGAQDSGDDELTGLIISEVDRMGRLAEKMENFGLATSESLKTFNIHTVLRRVKLLFKSQNHVGVTLRENYDPSLPEVFGDEDALVQAVLNLVGNALEAFNQSGTGDEIVLQTIYRSGYKKRDEQGRSYSLPIGVSVVDNGPGISERLQKRIFEPFITSKSNGHGLGLVLVSHIVDDCGGLINVETRPGRTEFQILLPISNNFNKEA